MEKFNFWEIIICSEDYHILNLLDCRPDVLNTKWQATTYVIRLSKLGPFINDLVYTDNIDT